MADLSQLDAMIARLRSAKDFVRAAGTTPSGAAWKPKKDGGRPLVHAADAIEVRTVGSVLVAKLRMPEALHSIGNARGRVRRPILPARRLPPMVAEAIRKSLIERGRAWLGGRS